ncbi:MULTISPECIES: class I tRNA ligase family protein [unclassified Streptomyces]|uniref:class I tRNA ligase family protein n=1 Tax=unclassified Streptomyces TaxID=2593676 RepID=UPI002E381730|nr:MULTISPECIES: class I tRNA ligase family protein [unclassified Streptomyces]WUC64203.1 class I tRNA ligase family protein [Streptomyces sp. NBC_00539]
MSTPVWITATPPAPHGELHVGHLAGPYVAADVLSRYLRAEGEPVLFTTGTADHSSSVHVRALRAGRKPEEVAEGFREAITADWLRSGIEFDRIVRPRQDAHYGRRMAELFRRLHAEGVIAARTRLMPYCEPCGRWLYGAHVTGSCPHCAAPSEGGTCHECARPNDGGDLLGARCARCGTPAALRRCRRLYIPLEPFRDALAAYWADAGLPPRLAALCESLLEDGLPDVAVTNPAEWGLPVPVDGFPEHRIDGCFETAAMHLFGYGDDRSMPERAVHFCGFGHAFCHAVLLPVLLSARGVKPAQDFCVNEAFVIEDDGPGAGRGAWALDLITEYGSDTLRRHVLAARPLGRRTHFRTDGLAAARRELDENWNGWLSRLFAAVRAQCGGLAPAALPGGTGWQVLERRLLRAVEDLREAYGPDAFDPRRAVALLDEVVRAVGDFGHVNAHGVLRPAADGRHLPALSAQLAVARALSAWARPVMPEGADRLASALGTVPGPPVSAEALVPPPPGTRLAPPSGPVFGF